MDANHKARLFEIREMAQAGVLTAAMIALSQLSIPLPLTPVPLTMSVFAVFLIASALPLRRAVMAQATYLLLGAIGLPVFAGFRGGIAVLFGPTGGYLIAYVPMTAAISLLISAIENIKWLSAKPVSKHAATAAGAAAAAPEPNPTAAAAPSRISNLAHAAAPPRSSAFGAAAPLYCFAYGVAYMIGLAILYAFGTAWLMNYSKLDFSAAMAAAVLPFVPLDVLKAAACAAAAPAVRRALRLRVSAPRQSA